MKAHAKILFVAFGVPLATWFGIRAYWEWLRWCGEAPTYYVATMGGFRACSVVPLQLLVMGALAMIGWAALLKSSWIVIAIAVAVAALLGAVGDAIGRLGCTSCKNQRLRRIEFGTSLLM